MISTLLPIIPPIKPINTHLLPKTSLSLQKIIKINRIMRNKFLYLFASLALLCGCSNQPAYKNTNLTPEERAEDLLKQLTLEEKVSLMMDGSAPVERLGIKKYNWWNEALHGIARSGLATVFPEPIGMAAAFDEKTLEEVFIAASDEARAKNTKAAREGEIDRYEGLTVWTPNVNIYRDPRWGRGIETYGEDPYLTSVLGLSVVNGLQCTDANEKYDKLHACAKHFAVHSGPEWNRHEFDANNINPRDLYETYLPAFETLVKEGKVKEVMCAYNRFEGEPCCGSDQLLVHILREEWGYDGIVVSDCGAINDFYKEKGHKTHPDSASASAAAVLSGTDLECGGSYKSLMESVEKGLIKEEDIDVSVKRLLKARFELGEMDAPEEVSWTKIPYSVVASAKHDSLALDIARKSITLLQNKNNILPLQRGGKTIAVMGPNANDSVMQWGNYNGIPAHTSTILQGIQAAAGKDDKVIYVPGCSWVERTLTRSVYNQCQSEGGTGFTATYWNNRDFEGEPVATMQMGTPFSLCTMGDIVFAPGVNLTDFSATYKSVFTPKESGDVVVEMYTCGMGDLLINGEKVKGFKNNHGGRNSNYTMTVEAGKSYDIELKFKYNTGAAQINFDLGFVENVNIAKTVAQVKDADVVVFAGGISPRLEGEEMGVKLPGFKGGDRTDIELPAVQRELLNALATAGKKVILVNCSGSPLGLVPETKSCQAIVQAWYPGQAGGKAVADVLFGDYNPSGKLPVTFYKNVNQLPDFEDYNMTGRTYRYFKGEPLYPFGYGLSYTTFTYGEVQLPASAKAGETIQAIVPVTNNGTMDGDEVVQLYLKKQGDNEGPIKTLRAFKRVHIKAGETVDVALELTPKQLEWWNPETNSMCNVAGNYEIMVGGNSEDLNVKSITLE